MNRLLLDEQTKQAIQCQQLGADLYPHYVDDDTALDEELSYGADPFDILAHKEEGEQQ